MAKFTTTVAFLLTSCGATASSSSGGNNSNNFLSGSASSSSTITYTEEEAERRRLNLSGNIKGSLTFKGTHTSQTQHSFQQQGSKSKHVTFSAGAHGQVHHGQVQHIQGGGHLGGQQVVHKVQHNRVQHSQGSGQHSGLGVTSNGNHRGNIGVQTSTNVVTGGGTQTGYSYTNNGSHVSVNRIHNQVPTPPVLQTDGFKPMNAQAAHVSGSSSNFWIASSGWKGQCTRPSMNEMNTLLNGLEEVINRESLLLRATGTAKQVARGCKTSSTRDIVKVRCDLRGNYEIRWNCNGAEGIKSSVELGASATVLVSGSHLGQASAYAKRVESGHCNLPFTINGDKEILRECARGEDGKSWCPVKTGRHGAFSTTNPKHSWMWCTVGGGSNYGASASYSTSWWTHSSSGYGGECKPPSREQMEKHLNARVNKIDLKQLLKTKGTGKAQIVPDGCKTKVTTEIVQVRCDLQGNFELQWNCGGEGGIKTSSSSSWSSSSSSSSSSSGAVTGAGGLGLHGSLNGHMNANAGFHHTTVTHHQLPDVNISGVLHGVLNAAGNLPKVDISKVDLSQVGKVGVAGALVGGIALAAGGLILHLSGEGESCVMKSNVDYWGHDLKGPVQPVQAATPKKCQDKCKATKDCHYFQWKENKNCWLKDINAENSPLANFLPHPTHISPGAVFGHKDCGFTESSSSSSTSSGSTSSSSGSSSSSSSSTSSSSGSSSSSSSSTSSSSNISSSSSTSPSILSSVSIQHTKEDGVETNINESTSSSITNINNVINYVIEKKEIRSCQEGLVLNEAQCKAVAKTHQKGAFKENEVVIERSDQPKGCFLKTIDNTVRYNRHAEGEDKKNKSVICLAGGSAHVATKRPPTATVPPSSTHVGHTNVVSTGITTTIDRLTNQKKRPWCMLHKVHKVVHAVQNFEDVIEPRRRELLF